MAKQQEKSILPLLAGAVGFGIVAALLAMFYLNAREAQLKEKYEQNKAQEILVVVANGDLRRGQEIKPEFFSQRRVPRAFVHEDAVFPNEFDRYIGTAITANIGRGKPLLKSFIDQEFPRDFSDVVAPGKRALTVTVDEINSIGGFLRPGNRVDIFVNIPFNTSGFSPELFAAAQQTGLLNLLPQEVLDEIPPEILTASESVENPTELLGLVAPSDVIIPVVQNLKVLATGRDPYQETLDALRQPQSRSESSFTNITLEVDPTQAALITIAQDKGEIVSLLRNRNDQSFSDFTTVSSPDLFGNAAQMAAAERERASRAATVGGVDVNGNLVDANGNKLMDRDQLAAAGYSVNENGQIVDKNGNVVDPNDIVVAPDGTVMTKQQLAAAGLTVNESGQIIDKDGNVIDVNDVVVAADGSVVTKQQLEASGLSVNASGEIVDANGRVVSPDKLVIAEDGTIITQDKLAAAGMQVAAGVDSDGNLLDANGNTLASKEQLEAAGIKMASGVDDSGNLLDADGNTIASREQLEAAGYTVNENGQIVDKNGNVVDPSNIMVDKDGNVVDPNKLMVDEDGNVIHADDVMIAADGNVINKAQLEAAGLSVNELGQVVDKDGNIVDPSTLVVASDGSVMTQEQLAAAGLSVNENGEIVDSEGNIVDANDLITSANGEILSKKQLADAGIKVAGGVDASGNLVDENGKAIASRAELEAAGYSINENGEIVDKDGNVVDPSDILVGKDGKILSEEKIAQVADAQSITGDKEGVSNAYDLIIGGSSEDGVARSRKVVIPEDDDESTKVIK